MVVSIKDAVKLFILSVMSCCAVFVCTLFLNYQKDLNAVGEQITPQMAVMYDALKMTSVVVCGAAGGGLLLTSVVMMVFYVKHYIDVHKKELGILKALGVSRIRIAKSFWVFGISVFIGAGTGFAGALLMMPTFYGVQNENDIVEVAMHIHPTLFLLLVVCPAVFFGLLAVVYACFKLRTPVLFLIKDNFIGKHREKHVKSGENATFLKSLKGSTVKSRKSLIFFVIFASFCYGGMMQMSFGVRDFTSGMMRVILLVIGIVLAFVTLFLAITTVIGANRKTVAMMKVFGYPQKECCRAILGGYRPLSYIGFALGTVYQYLLLKIMVEVVFSDFENVPEYQFDVPAMLVSLVTFIIVYEALMIFYARKLKRIPLKEIMLEG